MTAADYAYLNSGLKNVRQPDIEQFGSITIGRTPEQNLWDTAYEQARARIENPRVLAPGMSFDGRTGNIDAPDLVNEQEFGSLYAMHPEFGIAGRMTDFQREQLVNQQALREAERDRLRQSEMREKRLADAAMAKAAEDKQKALDEYNFKRQQTITPQQRVEQDLAKNDIEMLKKQMLELDSSDPAFATKKQSLDAGLADAYKRYRAAVPNYQWVDVIPTLPAPKSSVVTTNGPELGPPAPPMGYSLPTTMANFQTPGVSNANLGPTLNLTPTMPLPAATNVGTTTATNRAGLDVAKLRAKAKYAIEVAHQDEMTVAQKFKDLTGEEYSPAVTNAPAIQPAAAAATAPMPPFVGPMPMPGTNNSAVAAPQPERLTMGQLAGNIKQAFAAKQITEKQATDALAKLEQSIKQAFAAGKMTDSVAAKSLMEMGFSKAEAYEFLMSEE